MRILSTQAIVNWTSPKRRQQSANSGAFLVVVRRARRGGQNTLQYRLPFCWCARNLKTSSWLAAQARAPRHWSWRAGWLRLVKFLMKCKCFCVSVHHFLALQARTPGSTELSLILGRPVSVMRNGEEKLTWVEGESRKRPGWGRDHPTQWKEEEKTVIRRLFLSGERGSAGWSDVAPETVRAAVKAAHLVWERENAASFGDLLYSNVYRISSSVMKADEVLWMMLLVVGWDGDVLWWS